MVLLVTWATYFGDMNKDTKFESRGENAKRDSVYCFSDMSKGRLEMTADCCAIVTS